VYRSRKFSFYDKEKRRRRKLIRINLILSLAEVGLVNLKDVLVMRNGKEFKRSLFFLVKADEE